MCYGSYLIVGCTLRLFDFIKKKYNHNLFQATTILINSYIYYGWDGDF